MSPERIWASVTGLVLLLGMLLTLLSHIVGDTRLRDAGRRGLVAGVFLGLYRSSSWSVALVGDGHSSQYRLLKL